MATGTLTTSLISGRFTGRLFSPLPSKKKSAGRGWTKFSRKADATPMGLQYGVSTSETTHVTCQGRTWRLQRGPNRQCQIAFATIFKSDVVFPGNGPVVDLALQPSVLVRIAQDHCTSQCIGHDKKASIRYANMRSHSLCPNLSLRPIEASGSCTDQGYRTI